jgi:DNA adenine methylase
LLRAISPKRQALARLVDVWRKDWLATFQDVAEWYPQLLPNRVVAYLDPPYWNKSPRLYRTSFDPAGGTQRPRCQDRRNGFSAAPITGSRSTLAAGLKSGGFSYDNHPDLINDLGLYAAAQMTPNAIDAETLGVRAWRISKRLVDLRYSASFTASHRGKREELLLTTLPHTRVPVNDRFRPCP